MNVGANGNISGGVSQAGPSSTITMNSKTGTGTGLKITKAPASQKLGVQQAFSLTLNALHGIGGVNHFQQSFGASLRDSGRP